MLSPKEAALLKDELLSCKNPLFLFHDDPDGLASFLLCYRFLKEGRGLPVKAYPRITVDPYARKVEEFGADKVFVLDVAMVDQEFIDAVQETLDEWTGTTREYDDDLTMVVVDIAGDS